MSADADMSVGIGADDESGPMEMAPAVRAAIDAKGEYTSMRVTKLDIRRFGVAKALVGRDTDSHRAFVTWLMETHPDIDAKQLRKDTVATFESDVADA